ncbi:MAG: TlpA disulfide reductase family protein [Tepidiformaceae bacterium]
MSTAKSSWVLTVFGALAFSAVAGFVVFRDGPSVPERGAATVGLLDQRQIAQDEAAPDFALVSVRNERDVLRLSDLHGKVVVLNFYASWCGPCRRELPDFEVISKEFSGSVAFLAVNVRESPADALRILQETGATFPAVLDPDGDVARRYGLRGMPTTYVLDATGIVRKSGPGAIDAGTLRGEIRAILADKR